MLHPAPEKQKKYAMHSCATDRQAAKKPSMTRGFTLIELMIVVAIIGILALVALPAYRD